MPSTSAKGAQKLGERLLQELRATPLDIGSDLIQVSISIGVAAFPEHANGASHLVERADQALLRAKSEGKGRVVMAS
jgi:diguanylate cyclase (GGDEF)-like protein